MYAIENGMRCDGMIHINRLAGRVFLLCGSEWWFIFLRLGWDEYKKYRCFFLPCFIVTPHICSFTFWEGVLLPGSFLISWRVTHDTYFLLRLMG